MSNQSAIEWTDSTWNPTLGCSLVSPGCTNCYAMRFAHRLAGQVMRASGFDKYRGLTKAVNGKPVWTGEVKMNEDALTAPLHWQKPRRVFVDSMSDLFHEHVPDDWIDRVFAVMFLTPQHTYQILTKRPERMRDYLSAPTSAERVPRLAAALGAVRMARYSQSYDVWPLPNVWIGVSVEDELRAEERIPILLATPAAIRFISCEPLLGQLDILFWLGAYSKSDTPGVRPGLDWVVAGGESGPAARPMHPEWVRSLRHQCLETAVPFFFKQWGEYVDAVNCPEKIRERVGREVTAGRWNHRIMINTGDDTSAPPMVRVGKKRAGRMLDGREWSEYPV